MVLDAQVILETRLLVLVDPHYTLQSLITMTALVLKLALQTSIDKLLAPAAHFPLFLRAGIAAVHDWWQLHSPRMGAHIIEVVDARLERLVRILSVVLQVP